MIKLKEITWENFWLIINLKLDESQFDFFSSTATFMAQSYVNLKFGYLDMCFAVYDDLELIGFTKIVYVPSNVAPYHFLENSYLIDAIMIDHQHQGKGYGKKALVEVLKYIESKPFGEAESIKLLCHDENYIAVKLYEKVGFSRTNKFTNEEKRLRIYTKKNC